MKIKIFMATANLYLERDILQRFNQGIQTWVDQENGGTPTVDTVRIGRWDTNSINTQHTVEFEYAEQYTPCDVAVIFGSWKPREKGHHVVRNSVASLASCFLCIETPLLNRTTKSNNTSWRIGVNGFLNQSANWPQMNTDIANTRLSRLGISWQGWQNNPNGHIVLALQLPGDASLRGTNINDWAYEVIKKIRSTSSRPITIRNHPLVSSRAFGDHEELARRLLMDGVQGLKFSDGAIIPWSDDLNNAYCTVTFSSGLAVDSVIAGIPTVACDNGNFAWGISTNFIEEIEQLRLAEESQVHAWLQQLAMCQHTTEEIHNGQAWRLLLDPVQQIMSALESKKT